MKDINDYKFDTSKYVHLGEEPNYTQKYNELLMAVQWKTPGETRHESALRMIEQYQQRDNPPYKVNNNET